MFDDDKILKNLKESWSLMTSSHDKNKNIWFHGDQNRRKDFCNQKMDRKPFTQDPNANGPGIYFTNDYTQARGYAEPDGYVYTVNIDYSAGYIIKEEDQSEKYKNILFKLIKKAQEYNSEYVYFGLTDYGIEVPTEDDIKDAHIKYVINNFISNLNLIAAVISIYKEFFGREANVWASSMVDIGILGFLQSQPKADHLIIYNCKAIDILKEEKYVPNT